MRGSPKLLYIHLQSLGTILETLHFPQTKHNTYIIYWYILMEKMRRWHYLFCKVNFHKQSIWGSYHNSYHKNITFTIEIETENKILFLDVLLIRDNSFISTKVYHRKNTNTDICKNWKSFATDKYYWKKN